MQTAQRAPCSAWTASCVAEKAVSDLPHLSCTTIIVLALMHESDCLDAPACAGLAETSLLSATSAHIRVRLDRFLRRS